MASAEHDPISYHITLSKWKSCKGHCIREIVKALKSWNHRNY